MLKTLFEIIVDAIYRREKERNGRRQVRRVTPIGGVVILVALVALFLVGRSQFLRAAEWKAKVDHHVDEVPSLIGEFRQLQTSVSGMDARNTAHLQRLEQKIDAILLGLGLGRR